MAAVESRIKGPFEVFDPGNFQPKVVERMVVVTNQERLLQVGDPTPILEGRTYNPETRRPKRFTTFGIDGLKVYSFVNAFGTQDCDLQMRSTDRLAKDNPDVNFVSFSRQPTEKLNRTKWKQRLESPNHQLVKIDSESAKNLGVTLEPDTDSEGNELADKFWNDALCRTVMLIGIDNVILHIEQLMDQEKQPNLEALQLEIDKVFEVKEPQI